MTAILWVILPILVAVGSALIAVYIMQQRLEVQLARERHVFAEARAALEAQRGALEEIGRLRAEAAKRQNADEILDQIRTERRRFVEEQNGPSGVQRFLVVQERLCLRNLPLSRWVENASPIEPGADIDRLAQALAVFTPKADEDVESNPARNTGLRGSPVGR